jgi:phosphoribosyl-dephospho-CoA transferase
VSAIAAEARALAAALLPIERTINVPRLADVDVALDALRALTPKDAYDEAAVHEAGVLLLRLRDAAQPSRA